jgi:hypothetical protein
MQTGPLDRSLSEHLFKIITVTFGEEYGKHHHIQEPVQNPQTSPFPRLLRHTFPDRPSQKVRVSASSIQGTCHHTYSLLPK